MGQAGRCEQRADLREWQRNPELGDVFLEEFLSKSVGRVCVEGRGNRGI